MSRTQVDREEWQRRYLDLPKYNQDGLKSSWKHLKNALESTERDWAKKDQLESEIEASINLRSAYDAFVNIYEPGKSGKAIAIYSIEDEELEEFDYFVKEMHLNS